MSELTLQSQIDTLLKKSVVLPKIGGSPTPDVETASVLESLALAMLTQPRSAYYVYHLARNGLNAAINAELAAIDTLKADVSDLGNTTYAIKDTSALSRAQAAMLQLSTQGAMSSSSGAFNRYSIAINDFLNQQLAKNIKGQSSTDMVRPGEEAGQALPTDLSDLKTLHSAFLDRLYALAVGITNFANTPFSSLVGANAIYRSKKDLDSLLIEIENDDSGVQSRDAATRLIAGRATLRVLGAPMNLAAPVLDTVQHIPADQLLSGRAAPTQVVASTSAGPFVLTGGGGLTITVGTQTVVAPSTLNQAVNGAAVVGDVVAFPVSVPANHHLFIRLEASTAAGPWTAGAPGTTRDGTFSEPTLGDGWYYDLSGIYFKLVKVTLNSGHPSAPPGSAAPISYSLNDVVSAITGAMSWTSVLPASGSYGSAAEFCQAGSSRIIIWTPDPKIQKLSISSLMYVMEDQSDGTASGTGASIFSPRFYTNSMHSEFGFQTGQSGETGSTPAARIFDAMSLIFSSLVSTVLNSDGSITLTSNDASMGVTMSVSGSWASNLGLLPSYVASTTSVMLIGEGAVVSPIGRVDIGDVFECSTGSARIVNIGADTIELDTALQTFEGDITVTSALLLMWEAIDGELQGFLEDWLAGPFASGLPTLDQVIAVIIGSPSSPRRNEAIDLLSTLESQLLSLQAFLLAPAAALIPYSGTKEKAAVNNIISLFIERKLDRALDFFLNCKLQDVFSLDWQSASYGGNLMKAAEDIAQSDVKFPSTVKDEGFDVGGLRKAVP